KDRIERGVGNAKVSAEKRIAQQRVLVRWCRLDHGDVDDRRGGSLHQRGEATLVDWFHTGRCRAGCCGVVFGRFSACAGEQKKRENKAGAEAAGGLRHRWLRTFTLRQP